MYVLYHGGIFSIVLKVQLAKSNKVIGETKQATNSTHFDTKNSRMRLCKFREKMYTLEKLKFENFLVKIS